MAIKRISKKIQKVDDKFHLSKLDMEVVIDGILIND